jgi:hypothetical protein
LEETPMEVRKVKLFSEEMRKLARTGTQNYQPVYPSGNEWFGTKNDPLVLKEEGGVTQVSLDNLERIGLILPGAPRSKASVIVAGPKGTITFWWPRAHPTDLYCPCYVATGFGLGYNGEGPTGLARIANKMLPFGFEECLSVIARTPRDWQGVLFCR